MAVYRMAVGKRHVVVATSSKEDKSGKQFSVNEGDILELCLDGKKSRVTYSRGFFCTRVRETKCFNEVLNARGLSAMLEDTQYREATPEETEQHFQNMIVAYSKIGRKVELSSRITSLIGDDPKMADIFLKSVCNIVEEGNITEIETALAMVKICTDSLDSLKVQAKTGPVAEKFKRLVKDDESTDIEDLEDTDGDSFEEYGEDAKDAL